MIRVGRLRRAEQVYDDCKCENRDFRRARRRKASRRLRTRQGRLFGAKWFSAVGICAHDVPTFTKSASRSGLQCVVPAGLQSRKRKADRSVIVPRER